VQRVSGVTLDIRARARRPGDIPGMVAAADRIRSTLDWKPLHDDLDVIVGHALAWELALLRRLAA
jgi:UDP-glucose 4-epimerase